MVSPLVFSWCSLDVFPLPFHKFLPKKRSQCILRRELPAGLPSSTFQAAGRGCDRGGAAIGRGDEPEQLGDHLKLAHDAAHYVNCLRIAACYALIAVLHSLD